MNTEHASNQLAYLFDFDGTLVDSMPTFISSMLRILDENDIQYDDSLIKTITPLGLDGTASYYIDTLGLAMEKEQLVLLIKEYLYDAYLRTIPAKANVITTLEELKALGKDTFSISRGMVGTMADTKGVDIWVNFTESDKGVLCEIRSSRYNINPIAVKFGGGGHQKASGATVADRETAMKMLADLDAMIGETV